ncbi:MAG TPA: acyl-CoA dehydrogenase family protein, partial [Catenuloplanes sp.]
MRLTLSAEHRQFGASLHDLLTDTDVAAATAAWASGHHTAGLSLWRRLADLGVTGLAVPHRWGGVGAHPLDMLVACEELGHHAVPGPVAETVAAVPTLLCGVDDELAGRWLPDLADGTLIATLAAPPRLPYAVDADAAGLVLLSDDGRLCHGVPETGWPSVDETRRLFAVRAGTVLATGPVAARA